MLELDVRLTADGVPVVIHDATLLRTVGDPRPVGGVTSSELDALASPRKPLRLTDVLGGFDAPTRFLVELKNPDHRLEAVVHEALTKSRVLDRVQMQTFSRFGLRRMRRRDRSMSLVQLYPPLPWSRPILADLRRLGRFAQAIAPAASNVDVAMVAAAHANGMAVQPYTVNEPAEMDRLLALGVDGIITDVPGLARRTVGRPEPVLAIA